MDMSGFHRDLEKLLPDLTRFARVLTRNEDDAYDLVQDCVERALRKRALFNDGSSLKSWLFTVMRNLFVSQRRRAALDQRYASSADISGVQSPCQIDRVFLNEAVAALKRLAPSESQAIIVLGIFETSQQDMAVAMREPVGTLKSRLCRGRAHLKAALAMDPAALPA
jgi:RNA polymerase sigma-70 factor (ECF subfamily)